MDKIYMTSFPQGKGNLEIMATRLETNYAVTNLGEFPGATAMIPKVVINPSQMGNILGFEGVEGLLKLLGETNLHVYSVLGENISDIALQLRQELGFRTSGFDRVHIARTPKELAVVEYARKHDSKQTADYILQNFSEKDLDA